MNRLVSLLAAGLFLHGCGTPQTMQGSGRGAFEQHPYISEIGVAQDTRYFRIVEKVRCDEFDTTILVFNPPEWTTGWTRRQMLYARPVVERCGRAFRERYDQGDPALKDSDGVLIDGQTAGLSGEARIVGDGWAIKFADPTKEDISQRLKTPAKRSIDLLQLRTALNWIKTHQAAEFIPEIRAVLPGSFDEHPSRGWGEGEMSALRVLANLGDKDFVLWMGILRAGVYKSQHLDARYPAIFERGEHALIAGKVVGCSGQRDLISELEKIARNSTAAAHKMAAAQALVTLGERERVQRIAQEMKPSPTEQLISNMARSNLPYSCTGMS
ncbi:hypothetical protein FBQ96_13510 [Nitrospirales bacterium NOB]|nr:hypothetical protein [Nitrospirales bacterium NOB]